jgi:ribosomal protein S18 acetylase RimI-like enzyme
MGVRSASAADAERIAQIHVLGWQGGYQGLMPPEYLAGLDPGGERLARWSRTLAGQDWPRSGTFVVSGDSGEVAGFAHAGLARDEDADGAGEIWAIYLDPAEWGRGLGRELMGAVLSQLAGAGFRQATLWVLDTNARARRFYEAAGFRSDGAVKVDDSRGFPLRELRYRRALP